MANFTIKQFNGASWVEMMPKTVAAQVQTTAQQMFISQTEKDSYALKVDKNVANGYAGLDAGGKILSSQLPASLVGAMRYMGVFDADTQTAFPVGATLGDFYIVSGAHTIDGLEIAEKDHIIFNGTSWDKIDNTESVTSVNGATGAIVITPASIEAVPTSDVVSIATANKILKLNADAKLEADVIGNLTGNASSATKLATPIKMSLSGDVSGEATFDGSVNFGATMTLADTGVTAGQYTKVTVDSKGRVTVGGNLTLAELNGVAETRKINGYTLDADVTLDYTDVGAEKKIAVADTAPATPENGQFWYDTAI